MRPDPKFYIRRFEVWGGGWHYAVAERETRKLASSMFKRRPTAEKLLERMEADWQRWLDRDGPLIRLYQPHRAVRQSRGKPRQTGGVRQLSL